LGAPIESTKRIVGLLCFSVNSFYARMIARGLPRAAGLLKHASRTQTTYPAIAIFSRRAFTTPTKPLNATEVTIERDALLSSSARTFSYRK
jgi:hypothetical protein